MADVYRNAPNIPDPSETVFRAACKLLDIQILPARICWLGIGLGLKFGRVSLFGEIRLNETSSDLKDRFKDDKYRLVKAVPAEVKKILYERSLKHRHHFEVLLALSLAGRKPKEVKISTSTVPSEDFKRELQRRKPEHGSSAAEISE